MKINLNLEELSKRHHPKDRFIHKPSHKIKLFPFRTKWDRGCADDFIYFNGIIGRCFRVAQGKQLSKTLDDKVNFSQNLKNTILEQALSKTDSSNLRDFEKILTKLLFQGNNLFSFSKGTLPYLSFKKYHATLKEISDFIVTVFFDQEIKSLISTQEEQHLNILYKLILSSLPELENVKPTQKDYYVFNEKIVVLFKQDFKQLSQDKEAFLRDIGKLLKYYYFFYISQLALQLNDFFSTKNHQVYFTLETESISKSRYGFSFGWKILEPRLHNLFSHANALELLNNIELGDDQPKTYKDFKILHDQMNTEEQAQLRKKIQLLEDYYKEKITKPDLGWEECDNQLQVKQDYNDLTCPLEKAIYQFWFIVDFQFLHTARKKPYGDYRLWFTEFCRVNFLKRRGRIGYTLRLTQEMLLFLTKLCIGDKPKIRLKLLWEELGKRGVYFDEPSKVEVVRIFEKINLIEKKSDSGDAQYVRSIL